MLSNELKCAEILMKYICNNQRIRPQIIKDFNSSLDFERAKTNLFNLISINTLLSNYSEKKSFDIDQFLKDGIIPNVYDTVVPGPTTDSRYIGNNIKFFYQIIDALKKGEYTFDEDSNVYICSETVETVISTEWLYRLAHAHKNTKYQRMYLFNKKEENNISDENSLNNYLYHTKTFVVELTTPNTKKSYEDIFVEAENKTNNLLKNQKQVSVDQIINLFVKNINPRYNVEIKKYKLPSNIYIIKKANQMGIEFYNQPLEFQKELINKWMLEYINSNDLDNDKTQEFLILTNAKNGYDYPYDNLDRDRVIIGLFSIYLNSLSKLDLDFDTISLSDFVTKTFISGIEQKNHIELTNLIKQINKLESSEEYQKVKTRILSIMKELTTLDIDKDSELIEARTLEYSALNSELQTIADTISDYKKRRNTLQNVIRHNQENGIQDLAFDNNRIYKLLKKCTERGRVYFSPLDKTKIILETYNAETGKITYQAEISIGNVLMFLESNNYIFEENPTLR